MGNSFLKQAFLVILQGPIVDMSLPFPISCCCSADRYDSLLSDENECLSEVFLCNEITSSFVFHNSLRNTHALVSAVGANWAFKGERVGFASNQLVLFVLAPVLYNSVESFPFDCRYVVLVDDRIRRKDIKLVDLGEMEKNLLPNVLGRNKLVDQLNVDFEKGLRMVQTFSGQLH